MFTYSIFLSVICICTDPSIQLQTFQSYLEQLKETVTMENTFVHSFLPHINSLLHSAVLACKAASSSNSTVPSTEFQGELKIAPNKNMEHQWRFKQTGKAPGRKKKGNVYILWLVWLQHAYTIESLLIPYLINAHLFSHANKEERMTILDELTNGKNITEVIFNYKECLLNNLA